MNDPPCGTCIGLAVCINKEWPQIIKHCSILTEYMISFLEDPNLEGPTIKCEIDSLNKVFEISTVGQPAVGKLHVTDKNAGYGREWLTIDISKYMNRKETSYEICSSL